MYELVHRKQLDGGDPQVGQIVNRCRMSNPSVSSSQLFGDGWISPREALDVSFINDRLVQRSSGRTIVVPLEIGTHDDRAKDMRRAISRGLSARIAPLVGEHGWIPLDLTVDRFGIGIC